MATLIWAIVAILAILWLAGIGFHIGGSLIFLLFLLAIIGVVYQLAVGVRAGTRHHQDTTEVPRSTTQTSDGVVPTLPSARGDGKR